MRFFVKALVCAILLQLFLFVGGFLIPSAPGGSVLDTITGILALVVYVFYLIPIGTVFVPIFGSDAKLSELAYFLSISVLVVFYAALISLGYGTFKYLMTRAR